MFFCEEIVDNGAIADGCSTGTIGGIANVLGVYESSWCLL